ncbi:GPI ethanolamine phosphate transferase 2-like protein [Dinothrombium tinctorium]|uniref:GPI ethanolamine phosphate transferase 2-like protein n=1 Tax=Dinothrombium tinctorium TaxID=1965070 RepID=A0A3S3NMI9_9ACAR|nr:GPI ethanolamine phosphate transferase 2-like protein [Dinothrombium tinctorium]RWS05658.1 GPI ethanolamine phosphate transferase 2-like protein [Dinothrombium tinctorium]RWS05767.1 GPI ethanolamine phosphate transferase 2-like protein [Dinothrombium tinctorium]
MPFVERLIAERKAIAFVSDAQTPTVTMPRIKALLSGNIPNFLDLIFNLNAAKFGDDNLIERAFSKNKRIVFYGDDTWTQMFEESIFLRSNVTHSFFATDYTTVDTNVTENLIPELTPERLEQWDYLILHYLGVDHIGHAHGGANSSLMPAKLIEMDNVIKLLYETLKRSNDSYLMVITGDHGMTEAGNHGGSTNEEIKTALVFISNRKNNYTKSATNHVKQIDLAITLSTLLGLQIPEKSRGKLILPVIDAFESDKQFKLCYLFKNAVQLWKLDQTASIENTTLTAAINAHAMLKASNEIDSSFEKVRDLYLQYITTAQLTLISDISERNLLPTLFGIALGSLATLGLYINKKLNKTQTEHD